MLTCKQVTLLLSEGQERPLRMGERLSLNLHLMICKGCANFRRQIDFLHRASRQFLGRDEPPAP